MDCVDCDYHQDFSKMGTAIRRRRRWGFWMRSSATFTGRSFSTYANCTERDPGNTAFQEIMTIDFRVVSLAVLVLAFVAACSVPRAPGLTFTPPPTETRPLAPTGSPVSTDTLTPRQPVPPDTPEIADTPAHDPSSPSRPGRPLLMAHYMPWYQAPSVGGYWGWHWTMDHFNPDRKDENDRREIASHTYPLTGPYDSRDADLLEYQVLLMVLSGIDGVIVDWYGIKDVDDYALINASTQRLFEAVKTASLRFAICYEDWTIRRMVDTGHLTVGEVYTHGQEVMLYLQETWFGDSAYLRIAGQPVLLTFGPQYYRSGSDWEQLFSVLDSPPTFFTLDRRLGSVAMGAYPWPPMWASRDGVLTQEVLNDYLLSFYKTAESWDHRVASAFPGFHDIYAEAGVQESYGYLDAADGKTFESTLQLALDSDPDVVQLVTWNDYGEGTGIEPTVEFGYQYLETVQEARASIDPSFTFKPEDLAIPLRLYDLRKTREGDPQVNATLDRAFDLVVQGELAPAVALLDSINN